MSPAELGWLFFLFSVTHGRKGHHESPIPPSTSTLASGWHPSVSGSLPSAFPPLQSQHLTCCDLWEGLAQGSQTGKFPVYTRIP